MQISFAAAICKSTRRNEKYFLLSALFARPLPKQNWVTFALYIQDLSARHGTNFKMRLV